MPPKVPLPAPSHGMVTSSPSRYAAAGGRVRLPSLPPTSAGGSCSPATFSLYSPPPHLVRLPPRRLGGWGFLTAAAGASVVVGGQLYSWGIFASFGLLISSDEKIHIWGWAAMKESIDPAIILPLYTSGICTICAHQDKDGDLKVGVKCTALRFRDSTKHWIRDFGAACIGSLALSGYSPDFDIMKYRECLTSNSNHLEQSILLVNPTVMSMMVS
ncbi:hypothetical protein E2562_019523 [Oryza meyeriana var. granulata]|uniref:Uncharacterized protein n=1 Tax=Oryza meyeriana var. granulata TaxID=110450 RepID=A0A6G1CI08_9ORYZ|nr:hypothetical protein E2562_019523 [Oryza meyeriana var. granulata]